MIVFLLAGHEGLQGELNLSHDKMLRESRILSIMRETWCG